MQRILTDSHRDFSVDTSGGNVVPSVPRSFLEITDLTVEFLTRDGPVLAVDNISLAFDRGSFVCIVGPSGCGKTTLLQSVGGFVSPQRGEIFVDGRRITGPGRDRGMVFQQPALFPWSTVVKNAEFGPMLRGVSKQQRRADVEHYLKLVGLWEFRNRYTYQLSGGMQHRLAIVRAIVNAPDVLLLDEPFAALDALSREHMQDELRSVWQTTGMTAMFVTHSVEEAIYLGTHVVVMSPRPGVILDTINIRFSEQTKGREGRSIKASPEFVAIRERILSMIWQDSTRLGGLSG